MTQPVTPPGAGKRQPLSFRDRAILVAFQHYLGHGEPPGIAAMSAIYASELLNRERVSNIAKISKAAQPQREGEK
jgi:hypothetical protein